MDMYWNDMFSNDIFTFLWKKIRFGKSWQILDGIKIRRRLCRYLQKWLWAISSNVPTNLKTTLYLHGNKWIWYNFMLITRIFIHFCNCTVKTASRASSGRIDKAQPASVSEYFNSLFHTLLKIKNWCVLWNVWYLFLMKYSACIEVFTVGS